ncbi:MdtA/MuxA family multidrug efflux RND transporter periplasmic adaptor subunit [Candidatus Desulfovibrio trichonymphae]|uniref:Multidrug efflux pump subunit MdtA n=1 Tax=Candidatus Desulfovibrio trichonymphae TaxID=1725232 RepID=A0A1J1DQS7_9BACT|nr:MdtA/MuxA family multidrug efflux RND transporter periplasmic adaptor subunit [Candidatus Desulfovibrio trichonymphae]BAV92191.1 multidrug efflux pump subunit MdtA [Candidatus Desulfovibrio trichonymphae]GHU92209.1 multidrug resistance protein MdtA [Deltaproteobacteria bacterium]GHU96416.1 multidrug resistance protein MdtA [Deltaproteobacteria bacterium]GHV00362.1 multidrug resistance protein MdtA [Deltaproteobacteria bacterium]
MILSGQKGPRRKLPWLLAGLAALGLAWRIFFFGGEDAQRVSMQQPPVRVAIARVQDMPHYLGGLGTALASSDVLVTSRVDGELVRLHFQEGRRVRAGDLLAEIDPRPYEAKLGEALGTLARDEAQLANARRDLARYARLAGGDFIAAQQYETQRSLVRQHEGTVEADKAAMNAARLQLEYSRVTAPAGGRLGLKQVDEGNQIKSSDANGLVRITETSPCDVIFTLPGKFTPLVMRALRAGEANPDSVPPPVEAWDQEGKILLATGRLVSMDNQIDAATGTIRLKARFANTDERLYPNQFVNARLKARTLENTVTIPSSAVQLGARGPYVFVIDADNTARVREVAQGIATQGLTVIDRGIGAGDRVVTDGIDRLRDGIAVTVAAETQTPAAP